MRLAKVVTAMALPLLSLAQTGSITLFESGALKWTLDAAYLDSNDSDYVIFSMRMP